jgi:tol-pal system protein YbgF
MKILAVGRLSLLMAVFGIGLVAPPSLLAQALTPDQLTKRVEETSRALEDIQKEIKRVSTQIDNRAVLELLQRMDELADEISQLRGEFELQASDLEGIKNRQRELYIDIDRRMRDLEDRSSGQASIVAPVPVPSTGGEVASGSVPDTTVAPTPTPKAGSSATVAEEKAAYQVAFDSLKEGRYKKAKDQFSQFLKNYPDSIYAGNAQYWLGEANYVTRNFKQAITEFNQVFERYPTSAKIPDAMLKLGYTHYELKQYDQAKSVLQDLRTRYPNSTAARLAGKRLDRMRKEGV